MQLCKYLYVSHLEIMHILIAMFLFLLRIVTFTKLGSVGFEHESYWQWQLSRI